MPVRGKWLCRDSGLPGYPGKAGRAGNSGFPGQLATGKMPVLRRRLCRDSGIPAFRHSGIPAFRHSGIPVFRDSGFPGFRYNLPRARCRSWEEGSAGIPVFRDSGIPPQHATGGMPVLSASQLRNCRQSRLYRDTGNPLSRNSVIAGRAGFTGIPGFRCNLPRARTPVQGNGSAGIPGFRFSGIPGFRRNTPRAECQFCQHPSFVIAGRAGFTGLPVIRAIGRIGPRRLAML